MMSLLILAIAPGCHISEKPQAVSTSEAAPVLPSAPRSIKGCYAQATVLEILPDLQEGNPDDACANVPCYARIRIDRVVNRGMECHNSVHGGAELKVFFSCSLVKTGEALFPGMNASFPGLNKNDKFAATFLTYSRGNKEAITYTVRGYQKTE